MSASAFEVGAVRSLSKILPLDTDTLTEVVRYASSLSGPDEVAIHFRVQVPFNSVTGILKAPYYIYMLILL